MHICAAFLGFWVNRTICGLKRNLTAVWVWMDRHIHEAQRIRRLDVFIVRNWEVTPLPQPHRQISTAPLSLCDSRVKEVHTRGSSYHTGTSGASILRLRLYKTQQESSGLELWKLIWTEEQSHVKGPTKVKKAWVNYVPQNTEICIQPFSYSRIWMILFIA